MKRFLIYILAAASFASACTKGILRDELTELHSEIDELRSMLVQTNSNIDALQAIVSALQSNDYVTGITPIVENQIQIGYTITFSQSGPVVIYHGKDGYAPEIGIEADPHDGTYYWTLDGEWLLDKEGNRITAVGKDGNEGIAPQLKIDEGMWYISYDDGMSWTMLGKASGDNGDPMFKEIEIHDNSVTFVLSDGQSFSIPRNARVKIILDITGEQTGVIPGSRIKIGYTLENATDSTIVSASSDGIYTVRTERTDISHGNIFVQCPYKYEDGFINIMVSDGSSYSFLKVISFYEEKMILEEGPEFHLSSEGGEIKIPFRANFDFRYEIGKEAEDWISIISADTRSQMWEGELRIMVDRNDYEWARSGRIRIIPLNSAGDTYTEIIINQASAHFSIQQSSYMVSSDGDTIQTLISSSRGLSVRVPDYAADWIESHIEDLGENDYRLTSIIKENLSGAKRSASVSLYSDDGNSRLGEIEYVQSSPEEDEIKNMIITVRANVSNDFTASLWFDRHSEEKYDFHIDWGDGQAERITGSSSKVISHRYDIDRPESFTVSISGSLEVIRNSESLCITDIVQWGQTGLRSINLSNNYMLETLAGCSNGEFKLLESINLSNCPALKEIPEDLFSDCKSLTNLSNIFYNCRGITSIPDNLFRGCVNATSFYGVFYNCTGIREIPEDLFAQCRQAVDFGCSFYNCTGITQIPEQLFAECAEGARFDQTFAYCKGIQEIPEDLFANCVNATNFNKTFYSCQSITEIPGRLFRQCGKATSFNGTFSSCNNLMAIPSGLFEECTEITDLSSTFSYCSKIKEIPQDLFKSCTKAESFSETFAGMTYLEKVPADIFDNCRKVTDFSRTFSGCGNYSGESPYTKIDGVKYHLYERQLNPDQFIRPSSYRGCFTGCHKMEDYDNLRQFWPDWK